MANTRVLRCLHPVRLYQDIRRRIMANTRVLRCLHPVRLYQDIRRIMASGILSHPHKLTRYVGQTFLDKQTDKS